jgi:hypothetical protein
MNNLHTCRRRRAVISRTIFCSAACFLGASALAQEAIEQSQLVDQGRRARKAAIDRDLYPLKAGPVLMRYEASMGVEFNDNPNLLDEPDEVDFAFHPQVDIATLWTLNPRNALSLNLGLGYMKYINHTELDHVIIAPSSELALDIYTGDFAINLHERASYTQNPVNDPTVSGTGDFGGIENTAGLRVDYNLNQLTAWVGYDHYNFFTTSDGISDQVERRTGGGMTFNDVQDRASDLFYGRVGLKVTPSVVTGIEAGGSFNKYESDFFHDNTQFSVGAFAEAEVSQDLKGRVAGGYVQTDFDSSGIGPAPDSVNDFYAELSADHQLNQYMNHRLALGREARSGVSSELVTMWYARYENNWMIHRMVTLKTGLFYENGKERSGFPERFQRVGGGIGATVPLSRKLSVTGAYQGLYKDSDQPMRDYLQNIVSLEVRYVF